MKYRTDMTKVPQHSTVTLLYTTETEAVLEVTVYYLTLYNHNS